MEVAGWGSLCKGHDVWGFFVALVELPVVLSSSLASQHMKYFLQQIIDRSKFSCGLFW